MLRTQAGFSYGDAQSDIRAELHDYSTANKYPTVHYADAVCRCGGRLFKLLVDDTAGAALRICRQCGEEHAIGDSADYLADAELTECECPCGGPVFEVTVGVALYRNSDDVRWLYIGCRCPVCGLTACYADWKNEFTNYRDLLANV